MSRDRIIYQSESLFTSKPKTTGQNITSADIKEVNRFQEISYNFEVTRTDINEFGQLAALSREVTESPTVALDFSYYLTDGTSEKAIGLNVNDLSSANALNSANWLPLTASMLDPTKDSGQSHGASADELNYYIVTAPEGNDVHASGNNANLNTANHGLIGIGNGFITSYGINAAVGELATANVSVEGSNISFEPSLAAAVGNMAIDKNSAVGATIDNTISFANVASNTGPSVTALRPGDIAIDFDARGWFDESFAGGLNVGGPLLPGQEPTASGTAIHVQSVSLELPVSRSPLNRLGSHFPFARKTDFPVNMTLSVSALATDLVKGSLDTLICGDEAPRDIAIIMQGRCGEGSAPLVILMRNALLDSESFSSSIGDNKTVDLTFSSQLGGANDKDNGIFYLSGVKKDVLPGLSTNVTTTTAE